MVHNLFFIIIYFAVRRVRMGLDPPTGCTYASFKSTSTVKLESFQLRLSNVKSALSSERKVLKRERVTPVVAVKGSLLDQSLAYIIVRSRRYMKEVPELIKAGFSAWRSSSSTYEVVQGIFFWLNFSSSIVILCIYLLIYMACMSSSSFTRSSVSCNRLIL